MKIHWNSFLKKAVEAYPKEACAFLFSKRPYSPEEEWYVCPVDNIADNPEEAWIPDRKQMYKAKAIAIFNKLVKIGNIHSHPYIEGHDIEELIQPSKLDLKFARRFNDVIRGIMVVGEGKICGIMFHDKFGNKIDIQVVSDESK